MSDLIQNLSVRLHEIDDAISNLTIERQLIDRLLHTKSVSAQRRRARSGTGKGIYSQQSVKDALADGQWYSRVELGKKMGVDGNNISAVLRRLVETQEIERDDTDVARYRLIGAPEAEPFKVKVKPYSFNNFRTIMGDGSWYTLRQLSDHLGIQVSAASSVLRYWMKRGKVEQQKLIDQANRYRLVGDQS